MLWIIYKETIKMTETNISFNDGASYEKMMGKWSQITGEVFLDWLKAPKRLDWLDVGCGNGAFTETLIQRCSPTSISGIDPFEGQLKYARERPACRHASFQLGDAIKLPYADDQFDAAVMALVIFFVPEPAKGVSEMFRVVRPGGLVSAYVWDILEGGFPLAAIQDQLSAMGIAHKLPPSSSSSKMTALNDLWRDAGLISIDTTEITVKRRFTDFQDYWNTAKLSSTLGPVFKSMNSAEQESLKLSVQNRLQVEDHGEVEISARANAIRGQVPQ